MTDEGRRDDLPLQGCDAEICERRDDCMTERGKRYEADDEERRDDDRGTQIGYEVQHRGKHAPHERMRQPHQPGHHRGRNPKADVHDGQSTEIDRRDSGAEFPHERRQVST